MSPWPFGYAGNWGRDYFEKQKCAFILKSNMDVHNIVYWMVGDKKKKHKYTNVHKIKRYVTGKKSKYFNEA